MGNGLSTILLTVVALTNGQFARGLPIVFRWIKDISFARFALSATLVNELRGLELVDGGNADVCISDGSALLNELGLGSASTSDAWIWCAWLLFESVVFRILAYLALHFAYTGQSFRDRLGLLLQ